MVNDVPTAHLELDVRGPEAMIVVTGELDLAARPLFDAAVDQLARQNVDHVVVDIRAVEFIDIRGCRDLLELRSTLERTGHTVRIVAGPSADLVVDALEVRSAFV
jgi:anti-anti-sigma factor